MAEGEGAGAEAGVAKRPEPEGPREEPVAVGLGGGAHAAGAVPEEEGVLRRVGAASRGPGPGEVAEPPPAAVVAPLRVPLAEVLAGVVGDEEGGPARGEVGGGGPGGGADVPLRQEVGGGVVDEDGVEGAAEAEGAHVADGVGALRVEAAADAEHGGGEVHEGEAAAPLHVGCVVAAAGAEFEERARGTPEGTGQRGEEDPGLLGVVLRGREEGPPGGEGPVHEGRGAVRGGHPRDCSTAPRASLLDGAVPAP